LNRLDDQIMIDVRLNAKLISIHHFWNILSIIKRVWVSIKNVRTNW
jgi:hypothetical protein